MSAETVKLARPDPHARAAASVLGRALAEVRTAAASAWAQALECSVTVTPAGPPPHGPPTQPGGLPFVAAGLELADGRLARLDVDAHLLAGRLDRFAGGPGTPVGPLPLAPAEEGLFAWLALAWLALLPAPRPRLAWIHGGAPIWAVPAPDGGAVAWRVDLEGDTGGVRWWLPPDPVPSVPPRADLQVPVRLYAGEAALGSALAPSDHVPVFGGGTLTAGDHPPWPVRRVGAGWRIESTPLEVPMSPSLETLPVRVQVLVADLTLTVGQLSALHPGDVLPLADDPHPVVTLVVGRQAIAQGILVEDAGRLAVQITRVQAPEAGP